MNTPDGFYDSIDNNELLRRDFFSRFRNEETGNWSENAFRLRPTLKPPEVYLSLARTKIATDAVQHANELYAKSKNKLKKLEGYVELMASDIRALEVDTLECDVFAEGSEDNAHAGLFSWTKDRGFLDANSDVPELFDLQNKLLLLSISTYKDYPEEVKRTWKAIE